MTLEILELICYSFFLHKNLHKYFLFKMYIVKLNSTYLTLLKEFIIIYSHINTDIVK